MSVKAVIVQLSASFLISLVAGQTSFSSVWPSYTIKVLQSEEGSPLGFALSKFESSLVSSIPYLTSLVATLAAGVITEAVGRNRSQILCGLLFVVAWSLVVTARSTLQMVVARMLMGASNGMAIVFTILFVSEITEPSVRGAAIASMTLCYNVGVLVSYLMGWFCSYDVICYVNVTVAVGYVVMMACFKDSPVYLIKNGKEKEALNSLKFYRGVFKTTESVLEEFDNLKHQVKRSCEKDLEKSENPIENEKLCKERPGGGKKNPYLLLLTVDHNRRALFTIVAQLVLSVFLGMVAVQTYASRLFLQAAPGLSADLCSVLLAVALVLGSLLTVVVTDLVGRRFLMISACGTATLCLAVVGSQLRWGWAPAWLMPAAICLYCLAFLLGCVNIPFIQIAESFDTSVTSAATVIVLCSMFFSNFAVVLLFVPLVDLLGLDGAFFTFACNGALITLITFLVVKETRMVPLDEVQQMYARGYLWRKYD